MITIHVATTDLILGPVTFGHIPGRRRYFYVFAHLDKETSPTTIESITVGGVRNLQRFYRILRLGNAHGLGNNDGNLFHFARPHQIEDDEQK